MGSQADHILVWGRRAGLNIGPASGWLAYRDRVVRCALGDAGIAVAKREGDGATPAGHFPLRRVLYRADRIVAPACKLPAAALAPHAGWCDDPADAAYNREIALPRPTSAERLWRDDGLYDLIAVVGHNDAPPRRHLGSAIFLHVAAPGYAATRGCVGLARRDLVRLLAAVDRTTRIRILPGR